MIAYLRTIASSRESLPHHTTLLAPEGCIGISPMVTGVTL